MAEDNLRGVYTEALAAHEAGESEQAVQLYDRILARYPDADLVLYNRGLALYELARFAEAADSFSHAALVRDDEADYRFNLGLALKQDHRYSEAEQAYKQALQLQPNDPDILYNLANCCREGGNLEQAAAGYEQLLIQDPEHQEALNNFAYLCHCQHDYERAEQLYQQLLVLQPKHPGALHMLAAIRGTAEQSPASEYVRDLFDQYSDTFEQSLVEKLEYRVPQLLFDLLDTCGELAADNRKGFTDCLDLGCGTGLAGQLFKPLVSRLTGVDLSGNMVALAGEKGIYDRLATDDVVHFLDNEPQPFDLHIAADLLTYLADLEPILQAVAARSTPGSLFIFSTEHGSRPGWQIRPTGRFAHHPEYIIETATQYGWQMICREQADLRREGDDWVKGDLFILQSS